MIGAPAIQKIPKNRRTRCSLLIEDGGQTVLIDTPPDLRQQLLDRASPADRCGAVHPCACRSQPRHRRSALGQSHGRQAAADLRRSAHDGRAARRGSAISSRRSIPRRRSSTSRRSSRMRSRRRSRPPVWRSCRSSRITAFRKTTGYRFGRFAYSTDVCSSTMRRSRRSTAIEVWIVDCIRHAPHPTHSHVARTLELDRARETAPRDPDAYGRDAGLRDAAAGRCRRASSRVLTG